MIQRSWNARIAGVVVMLAVPVSAHGQVWEAAGVVPTGGAPRQYAAGINSNGVLYAIGGTPWQNGGDQDGSVHRFKDGVWSVAAPVGGAGPIISTAAGVDALGRKVVYGGFVLGDDGAGPDRVYSHIEGLTTAIAARPTPDEAIGYFAWAQDAQNRLYGFGGGPGVDGPNSGYSDRYDALTDSWSSLAAMPTPAADACAVYDGAGHVLVIGGINIAGTARLANVAQYDIISDTWLDSAIPDLPIAVSGARAVLGADGRVYVVGGESGSLSSGTTLTSVYKLEPATNSWVVAPSMATSRKWFACVLGDDDYIYAIGGDNDTGGTDAIERLFTPRCPQIAGPESQEAYAGSVAGFTVMVEGASPFTFQWRKNGVALVDGPTADGGEIIGAMSETLEIVEPGVGDVGEYDVVVSNDCGSVVSDAAWLTLLTPPDAPGSWQATDIHPAWANGSSQAFGISDFGISGNATITTTLPDGRVMDLAHPILWDGVAHTPMDITPPGSVGGAVLDAEGDLLVGWFWHTYSCPGGGQTWTCAWQSAGYWWADTLAFTETHMSGAEYDSAAATDGDRLVTNASFESGTGLYTSRPYLWTPPHSVAFLDPGAAVSRSTVSAIDGVSQFGSVIPVGGGSSWHAAVWSGSAASMSEIHPAGYTSSHITGAGDGQVVGQVEVGGVQAAALWAGRSAAIVELHRPVWNHSEVYAVHGGVQVGVVDGGAALWIGSPDSYVDLHAFVPQGFSSSSAQDVAVSPEGEIIVVGYGYNTLNGQNEALMWQGVAAPGDCNGDAVVDLVDYAGLESCLLGPGIGSSPDCVCFDLDGDGDVTLADFAAFQVGFTSR